MDESVIIIIGIFCESNGGKEVEAAEKGCFTIKRSQYEGRMMMHESIEVKKMIYTQIDHLDRIGMIAHSTAADSTASQ